MSSCKQCGKCCIVFNQYFGRWENCRFLGYIPRAKKNHQTYCKIYTTRLGQYLGWGHYCRLRRHLHYNIPGCPFNKPKQEIHPAYIMEVKK